MPEPISRRRMPQIHDAIKKFREREIAWIDQPNISFEEFYEMVTTPQDIDTLKRAADIAPFAKPVNFHSKAVFLGNTFQMALDFDGGLPWPIPLYGHEMFATARG